MITDMELVRDYAQTNSEAAFAELVSRHINLVYSVAIRQVGDAHLAQDVTQAVFIILARKAKSLDSKTILSGWLCRTARYASADALKIQRRRQNREQEAYMQSVLNESEALSESWAQIAPLLDAALEKLGRKDHDALVLRFFDNKSLGEVGVALGVSEDAAKMRVSRALEKLRRVFAKRGVASTITIIAGAVSANSVHAAPVGLAQTIAAGAVAKGAAAGASSFTLAKGALKAMAWAKAKTAITVGAGILFAAGAATVVVKESDVFTEAPDKYFLNISAEANWFFQLPPYAILRRTHFSDWMNGTSAVGNAERVIARSQDFAGMIAYAFNFYKTQRTVLPDNLPKEKFDFMFTVPQALPKFQAEIKRQLGYEGRLEVRNTNVLVLKVIKKDAPGLKSSNGWHQNPEIPGIKWWSNISPEALAQILEVNLEQPVVDQTGLKGNYDVSFAWEKPRVRSEMGRARVELKRIVRDQLGLELIETNMPIEMLIVEKVKK